MTIKVYNTLTKQKEEIQPIEPPRINMYVCGITPYDETHLGHARAYITFDVIRRYLEKVGYQVFYVQNVTDVDDKIINKAQQLITESGDVDPKEKCKEIVEKYLAAYFAVMDKLNVKRADLYPRATEHIPEMVAWIAALVAKDFAYVVDDFRSLYGESDGAVLQ